MTKDIESVLIDKMEPKQYQNQKREKREKREKRGKKSLAKSHGPKANSRKSKQLSVNNEQ